MSNSTEVASATLTIGELADRTGVAAATLRVWETRYGFPVPHRRASGHRRYDEALVDIVLDVVDRRQRGTRLDVAITQAREAGTTFDRPRSKTTPETAPATSVFARLRRTHPHLQAQQLSKSTLQALSWAIEDEFCARAHRAHMFGTFQKQRFYAGSARRWVDLARTTSSTFVFADFPAEVQSATMPHLVPLDPQHPLAREWAVVCDAPDLPVVLTAWELPGQHHVDDRERMFEAIWTLDPTAVREAARVCARIAADAGVHTARAVTIELEAPVRRTDPDPMHVTSLFNRLLAYTDRQR